MEKVKVRVRSAALKTFWYSKHIGKIFEVNKSIQFRDRYELVLDDEMNKKLRIVSRDIIRFIKEQNKK